MKKYILLLTLTLGICNISAQNAVHISLGTNYSMLTLNLGYSRDTYIKFIDRDICFKSELAIPMFAPDVKDLALQLSMETALFTYKDFSLNALSGIVYRSVSNDAFDALGIGTVFSLHPRYTIGNIPLGIHLEYDVQHLTYLSPSKKYLEWSIRMHARAGIGARQRLSEQGYLQLYRQMII